MTEAVGRAGKKIEAALQGFGVDVTGRICADFGSNVGGFVQVLLEYGAKKVFAVEKGYGVLDWQLRQDPRVVVMERTDARNVQLPQTVDLITVDVGWTRLSQILPAIKQNLAAGGRAILLLKPQYEAEASERIGGTVQSGAINDIRARVAEVLRAASFEIIDQVQSPLSGDKAGNPEWLLLVRPAATT